MKTLRPLVLFAVGTAAFIALIGSTTASATVLCKNSSNPCNDHYAAGTELKLSLVESSTLTSTNTETYYVTCAGGELSGKTSNTGGEGEAISAKVESLAWSGCSFTTDTISKGSLSIAWTSGSKGAVTSKESKVTIGIFGSCIYGTGAGTKLGTLEGGTTPKIKIHTIVKREGFCLGPAEAEWNATYHVTSPTPLYVAEELAPPPHPTVLCKNSSTPCYEHYPAGTKIEASQVGTGSLTSTTTETTYVTCSSGKVSGETSNTGGEAGAVTGSVESLTWSGCSSTTDTIKGGTLQIQYSSGSNGEVTSSGAEVTVAIFGSCVYGTGAGRSLGTLEGGTTPKLTIHTRLRREAFCLGPEEAEWNATYHVTSPTPLYVADELAPLPPTVLCKNSSNPCYEHYPAGTKIEASQVGTGNLTATDTSTTYVTCSGGEASGKTANTGGESGAVTGSVESLTWSGCSTKTTSIKAGTLQIQYSSGSNGEVTSSGAEVTVAIFGSCVYGTGAGRSLGTLEGGTTPKLTIHATVERQGFCLGPVKAEWNATYHVTSPTPLYVAES